MRLPGSGSTADLQGLRPTRFRPQRRDTVMAWVTRARSNTDGAEFGHRGDTCVFETLIVEFDLSESALAGHPGAVKSGSPAGSVGPHPTARRPGSGGQ